MSPAPGSTAKTRDEHAAKDAEVLFQQLMDSAPVMVWVSGPDKLCTWFNRPWLDFTGRTMDEERGNGWAAGVHPDDLQRCLNVYAAHFDQRIPFRMEYRLRRADGEYRGILDTGGPRFSSTGAFLGYIGSCIDINPVQPAGPGEAADAEAPPPPPSVVGDETRVRQIARALVTAHHNGAEAVATSVAQRHAQSGEAKIAEFWHTVAERVREILSRDE